MYISCRLWNVLESLYVYLMQAVECIRVTVCISHAGCGKTTFLDLLTGRRKTGSFYVSIILFDCVIIDMVYFFFYSKGDIFINGLPMEENRNWYLSNTGYVLQLAAPYYEELTVRENLTLAAWVKLQISSREKFQRVEQVMEVVRYVTITGI